ncbi:helix-turn-helix domain-containing protein [Kitasatospora aureofaciens]|uniref:helix-turn-helix domain-containing protein n=1 Tax=Kitasatospora aureofaciens TaxID=1894 RepID=UPI001C465C67|nr:helix-turn-helix transcriptional regulator [Kitasatospora aureofaciens]MBV6695592.1 helix-turn-helix domain-containing protein [Kitasatospora aureofaciens]
MTEQEAGSFADKLNHLFRTIKRDDGKEYSNEQVAAAISADGETTISQSYIWQLRKAQKTNPTLTHLTALADFFGVPVSYFVDDSVTSKIGGKLDALEAEQQRVSKAIGRGEVKLMAMRAGELSPERLQQVMGLLDVVYQLEQAERRNATND